MFVEYSTLGYNFSYKTVFFFSGEENGSETKKQEPEKKKTVTQPRSRSDGEGRTSSGVGVAMGLTDPDDLN